MARDPPSLASTSELRDLSLQPSQVRSANISIIHPQLRDLILPLARGCVLYPRGQTLEWQRWMETTDESPLTGLSGQTRPFAKLGFTPNCLTASGGILSCGGQHGELHMQNVPLFTKYSTSPPVKPFMVNITLPTRSINNSMVILPAWPGEWERREKEREVGRIGGRMKYSYQPVGEDHADGEEDEDEEMDMDIDEEQAPIGSPSSVATYPNTVPFLHPPRIPHLSPSPGSIEIPTITHRRSPSFPTNDRPRTRAPRASLSFNPDRNEPIYVTSRPRSFVSSARSSPIPNSSSFIKKRRARPPDEPRLLISNNDQTVKMFSLRPADLSSSSGTALTDSRLSDEPSSSTLTVQGRPQPPNRLLDRYLAQPPPRFGSTFGWDSLALNEGIDRGQSIMDTLDEVLNPSETGVNRESEEFLRREREGFERVIGMRVGPGGRMGVSSLVEELGKNDVREERKLAKVGGARFKCPINHSSFSPDLRTMVCAGDTTEVFLFEVIEGGREFRKIATYSAATDAGFSTAWSKDGRKFAVASQDGQVTVWDHRSSQPLAIFHTSSSHIQLSSPTFSSTSHPIDHIHPGGEPERQPLLVDPVTGDPSLGRSTSGNEAARVVKFSPEGSSRDLMVFSEENSNIHIIDARTFTTHVITPVPHFTPEAATARQHQRFGVESGTWGIAGVAFDPTGDWLYSGTERTVVEWDLRRLGGGEGGTWGLA